MKNSNNAVFGKVNTFANVEVNDDGSVTFRADWSTNSAQFYNNMYETGGNYEKALKMGVFAEDRSYLVITVNNYTVEIDKVFKAGNRDYTEAYVMFTEADDETLKYRLITATTAFDPSLIMQYAKETWSFLRNVMELVRKGEFTKEAWNEWKKAGSPSFETCKHCGKSFDEVQFGRNLYAHYTGVANASLCKRCESGKDEKSHRYTRTLKIEVTQRMVEEDGFFAKGVFVEETLQTRVEIDGNWVVYDAKDREIDTNVSYGDPAMQEIEREYLRFTYPSSNDDED